MTCRPCFLLIVGCALGLAALAAHASAAGRVTVFAAASLANAMAEVEERFEAATGYDLVVALAGSSALARQIQQGAPADVFISANPDWMDVLERDGLIDPGSRFDLLNNAIVLVAHGDEVDSLNIDASLELNDLLGGGWLAMALVDAVPAGIYGKAALEDLGLWATVEDSVAQTDNVRAALALVARGEARLGLVYATDAAAEPRVTVVGRIPASSHPPIVYPAAVVRGRSTPVVSAFMDYLRGPAGRRAFERQEFVLAD